MAGPSGRGVCFNFKEKSMKNSIWTNRVLVIGALTLSSFLLSGCGGGSDGGTGTASTGGSTTIATPSGVTVKTKSETEIDLGWTRVSSAQSYKVYYGTTSPLTQANSTSLVVSFANNGVNFVGALPNTTYYFSVATSVGTSESAWSPTVSATTAPASPTVSVVPANASATVTWTATPGVAYTIYYSGTSPSFAKTDSGVVAIPNAVSPLAIANLTNNTSYSFSASQTINGVESALAKFSWVMPNLMTPGSAPPIPAAFTVDCFFKTQPTFKWSRVAGATGYKLYHAGTSNFETMQSFGTGAFVTLGDVTTYSLFPGGTPQANPSHWYLTAFNASGESQGSITAYVICN